VAETLVAEIVRIVHQKYADGPFSGKGGLYAASRWARRGQLVSYAAESLALATLEILAGAGNWSRLSKMVFIEAEIDDGAIWTPDVRDLPEEWDRLPPGHASRAFGDAWLVSGRSVAMRVPSVILPRGWNVVLNPAHPEFADALVAGEPEPLDLDDRILRVQDTS